MCNMQSNNKASPFRTTAVKFSMYCVKCLCLWWTVQLLPVFTGRDPLSCASNAGFFFGLEWELCVGFEFHLISTCSRFKTTLCSSPWKTCLPSARTFVNLIEPANPCFSFSLMMHCCHKPHQRALLIKPCAF